MCPLGYLPGSSSTSVCPVWAPRPPLGLRLGLGLLPQKRGGHLQLSPTPAPRPSLYPPRASGTDLAVPASVTSLEFGVLSLSPGRLDSGHFADSLSLTAPRTPRVPTGDTRPPHLTDTPLLPLPALFSSTALMTFQPVILLTSLYYLYISFMFIILMMFVVRLPSFPHQLPVGRNFSLFFVLGRFPVARNRSRHIVGAPGSVCGLSCRRSFTADPARSGLGASGGVLVLVARREEKRCPSARLAGPLAASRKKRQPGLQGTNLSTV